MKIYSLIVILFILQVTYTSARRGSTRRAQRRQAGQTDEYELCHEGQQIITNRYCSNDQCTDTVKCSPNDDCQRCMTECKQYRRVTCAFCAKSQSRVCTNGNCVTETKMCARSPTRPLPRPEIEDQPIRPNPPPFPLTSSSLYPWEIQLSSTESVTEEQGPQTIVRRFHRNPHHQHSHHKRT